jgi:glutathione S-transferase
MHPMLQLRYSPTSPYVRKVLACAIELELEDRLELIVTDPWSSNTDIGDDNPLGKVPALLTPDLGVLYDSQVICEYFDELAGGGHLLPTGGVARIATLRRHALAHGMLDAAVAGVMERYRRPAESIWEGWVDFQLQSILRGLPLLAADLSEHGRHIDIATLSAGCLLGYLDLRYANDLDWRREFPALGQWFADFSQRPSMARTAPPPV